MPNSNNDNQTTPPNPAPSGNDPVQPTQDDYKPTVIVEEGVLPPMPQTVQPETISDEPKMEVMDAVDNTPAMDNGSAAPTNDLVMPEIVGTTPPKKKYAGGKVIATILGLFLLVGGVGAGVFLTGQNQDVREKAAATEGYRQEKNCHGGSFGEPGKWCIDNANCPNDSGGPVLCSEASWFPPSVTEYASGVQCDDVSEPCTGIGGNGGSPQCVDVIDAYDSNWNKLSDAQLKTLKSGDIVRFAIPGKATIGGFEFVFTAARFTINGVVGPEVTTKMPNSNSYYYEYTIPTGTTTFNITAELKWNDRWVGR